MPCVALSTEDSDERVRNMNHEERAELIDHAYRLHKALYALAISEHAIFGPSRDRAKWNAYDHTEEALVQILTTLIGDRERAKYVRAEMIDDSGEGVAYWLQQEREKFLAEAAEDFAVMLDGRQ